MPIRRDIPLLLLAVAALAGGGVAAIPGATAPAPADSTYLAGLAPLLGEWTPPMAVQEASPQYRDHVVHGYAWTVGRQAMRLREGYMLGHREEAQLDGLIYWDPATERIEFVAVGGHEMGQGRVFRGEYRVLEGGAIERIYDVFYRTLEDLPGEELGGSRRRYREVYTPVTADSMDSTLDWWLDGAWRPYNRGRYAIVRFMGEGAQ